MIDRSERIRIAIKKRDLSYADLERMTGISKSALQRYATGQTKKIPIDVIEKIADATGVTSRYLMGWEEEEKTVQGLRKQAESMKKGNAPNDKVRSAIVDKVMDMNDRQAERLLAFLDSMGE